MNSLTHKLVKTILGWVPAISFSWTLRRRRVWNWRVFPSNFLCNWKITSAIKCGMLLEFILAWLISFNVRGFRRFQSLSKSDWSICQRNQIYGFSSQKLNRVLQINSFRLLKLFGSIDCEMSFLIWSILSLVIDWKFLPKPNFLDFCFWLAKWLLDYCLFSCTWWCLVELDHPEGMLVA